MLSHIRKFHKKKKKKKKKKLTETSLLDDQKHKMDISSITQVNTF